MPQLLNFQNFTIFILSNPLIRDSYIFRKHKHTFAGIAKLYYANYQHLLQQGLFRKNEETYWKVFRLRRSLLLLFYGLKALSLFCFKMTPDSAVSK